MRIASVTLSNFRCFGPEPTTVFLDDFSILIGSNGSGKTALLLALARMFGNPSYLRRLQPDDFHVPNGEKLEDKASRSLYVEVKLTFPTLADEDGEDDSGVPEFFKLATIDAVGAQPYCRIRLTGTWNAEPVPDGEIDQHIIAIKTDNAVFSEDQTTEVPSPSRSRIQVVYVPASRDPENQLKYVAGTHLYRLLSSVEWQGNPQEKIDAASDTINGAMTQNPGIAFVEKKLKSSWRRLHDDDRHSNLSLKFAENSLAEVLKSVQAMFAPSDIGGKHDSRLLSDGQKALFYFALLSVIADADQLMAGGKVEGTEVVLPFKADKFRPPALTIYAVEEPETHVSPHYLGRIIRVMKQLAGHDNTQAIVSSHCASIVKRIAPATIRHFRIDKESHRAIVNPITLPPDTEAAYKYVKEAVSAYPELYFSRFVILVEGDSEEIILPAMWNAIVGEDDMDFNFVAVVPLSGRFVHHFWRLLEDIHIPYATLLDLDRERSGGGWGRIKYAFDELINVRKDDKAKILSIIKEEELVEMHKRDAASEAEMLACIKHLQQFNVFYSYPLDVDLMMACKYTNAYKSLGVTPRLSPDDARKHVLGEAADGATYSNELKALFPLYNSLFLGKGKPSTHLLALTKIDASDLKSSCPPVFSALITHVQEELGIEDEDGTD